MITLMTKDEYGCLSDLLKAVAEKQKTFAANMLKAEKRFARVERAIAELLETVEKRMRNK